MTACVRVEGGGLDEEMGVAVEFEDDDEEEEDERDEVVEVSLGERRGGGRRGIGIRGEGWISGDVGGIKSGERRQEVLGRMIHS